MRWFLLNLLSADQFVSDWFLTSIELFIILKSIRIGFDDGFDDESDEQEEAVKSAVGAKQFIAFSDSRQASAFYATYLDQTYRNILYKRLVVETLKRRDYALQGKNLDQFTEDLILQCYFIV